jgi:hypothetical protein
MCRRLLSYGSLTIAGFGPIVWAMLRKPLAILLLFSWVILSGVDLLMDGLGGWEDRTKRTRQKKQLDGQDPRTSLALPPG